MNVRSGGNVYLTGLQGWLQATREDPHGKAVEALAIHAKRYVQGATGKPGDSTTERQNLLRCVEAALLKRCTSSDGVSDENEGRPGILRFGEIRLGEAWLSLPDELLQALNSAAELQYNPIEIVVLPPGLTEMPKWLRVLTHVERVTVPRFAGQFFEIGDRVPSGARIELSLNAHPATSGLIDIQNKV